MRYAVIYSIQNSSWFNSNLVVLKVFISRLSNGFNIAASKPTRKSRGVGEAGGRGGSGHRGGGRRQGQRR